MLPMAHLKEKGKKFTSPLLIYSSNKSVPQQCSTMEYLLEDYGAIARRFHYEVQFKTGKYTILKNEHKLKEPMQLATIQKQSLMMTPIYTTSCPNQLADRVFSLLVEEWTRKSQFYNAMINTNTYTQNLVNDGSLTYKWDTTDIGHNRVKVHGIAEPLKVRTITIGTAKNHILKPLQKAMLKSLYEYPCFRPCKTPNYAELLKEMVPKGTHWISGDYSSATDGLHADIMSTAVSSLVEALGDHPIVPFLERESGVHLCEYPSWSGVPDTYQINGQLMGSLLSFPILCLANAFTVCYTQQKGLNDISALFHGDDLLMRGTPEQYNNWRKFTKSIGLELSMGKNYISPVWGSIDSQVFYGPECYHLGTGKYKCYDNAEEGAITELLRKGLPKAYVAATMKRSGVITPRSIDVSTEFGGLNPNPGFEPQSSWEKNIYFVKQMKDLPSKSKAGTGYVYHIPVLESLDEFSTSTTVVEDEDVLPECKKVNNNLFRQLVRWKKKNTQKVVLSNSIEPSKLGSYFCRSVNPFFENIIQFYKKNLTMSLQKDEEGNFQVFRF
jgi:hypothetical protein